jgi:hypothetical protein
LSKVLGRVEIVRPCEERVSPAKVEVAVVEKRVAERPPPNVEVPCPAPTVIAAAKVEVAVVEVATKFGAVTVPVKTPAPVTESGVPGELVPIPIFPAK